jgi:hypothetical protein
MEKIYPFSHEKEQTDKVCVVCGRKAGRYIALVVDGGARFGDPETEDDPDDGGYMGWWPVGSTCKKKLPKGFVKDTLDTV